MSLSQPETQVNQNNEQPVFSVEFTQTEEDILAWEKHTFQRNIFNRKVNFFFNLLLIALLITLLNIYFSIVNNVKIAGLDFTIMIIGVLMSMTVFYFVLRFLITLAVKSAARKSLIFLKKTKFIFHEDRLQTKSLHIETICDYDLYTNFYENENYLFLTAGKIEAGTFPKKFFTSEQLEFIKNKVESAKEKI